MKKDHDAFCLMRAHRGDKPENAIQVGIRMFYEMVFKREMKVLCDERVCRFWGLP